MMWFDVVAFSAAILVGLLFLYGALVRGQKLRARAHHRLLVGLIGVVLLVLGMRELMRALAR